MSFFREMRYLFVKNRDFRMAVLINAFALFVCVAVLILILGS